MDNLTTDFISFFVPYVALVLSAGFIISLPLSVHHIIAVHSYHVKREEQLKVELGKALSARRKAEREAEFQCTTKTAEIERLAKEVATLKGELSALRANSSKQK